MKLSIPDSDAAEFAKLPDDVRAEVRSYLRAVGKLMSETRVDRIGVAIRVEARELGVSWRTMRRKYDEYRSGGVRSINGTKVTFGARDWRVFINYTKAAPAALTLPREFTDFWKRIVERNQRKTKPAHRFLVRGYHKRRWQLGSEVFTTCPGYEAWPEPNGSGIPHGWSYGNLLNYMPTKAELATMREGLGVAIARHVPKVLHTRVGLWVMSHVSFDDVLRDMEALLISRNQRVRIQELGAFDFYSAHRFLVHRRPQYEENGRRDSIKERETRFVVASWVRNIGYSPRGTICLAELGTAAIREALEDFLYEHSNGLITVRRSGITGREQALKGYWGRGGGNPRHKPAHESHHNLLQNEAADLPAQVGHDRNPPEWLHGLEAVTDGVCRALATLDPKHVRLIDELSQQAIPMCEYWQLLDLLCQVDQLIAWRTDHKLEGWHQCGHTTIDYRPDVSQDRWLTTPEFLKLPAPQQQIIQAAALADPRYRRPRKLAPIEVYGAGLGELIKFPDHIIALMFCDDSLGEDLRETKSLTATGEFEIQNKFAGPEALTFKGFVRTPSGEALPLDERQQYGVVLNPWDAQQLWVYEARGGFIGTAPRKMPLSPLDDHTHVLGEREHQIADITRPLRERHANVEHEMKQLVAHNERITNDRKVTHETRLRDRAQRKVLKQRQAAAQFGNALADREAIARKQARGAFAAQRQSGSDRVHQIQQSLSAAATTAACDTDQPEIERW